jgi:outer membrane protein assembly factor BamB
LIADSLVIFGTWDGEAIAYERTSGRVAWSTPLGRTIWGRAIDEASGLALVPELALHALDPRSGDMRWTYAGPDGAAAQTEPAVESEEVFLGTPLGWAVALDAGTGQEIWRIDLGERPFRPTVAGDLVIYGTRGYMGGEREGPLGAGHVVALRRVDGVEVWRFPLPDSAGFPLSGGAVNGGVVWEDRVIVGSAASRLYALRLSDGARLWEHQGGSPPLAGYRTRPALLGGTAIVLRNDGVMEGVDTRSGDLRWRIKTGGANDPVVAGKVVMLSAGRLWMIREDGTVLWQWGGPLDNAPAFLNSPTIAPDGTVYVTATDPHDGSVVYAYAVVPPVRP